MADVPVPSIATATPTADDAVLGTKAGATRRFPIGTMFDALRPLSRQAKYPFRTAATGVSDTLLAAIKDVYIETENKNLLLAFFTLNRGPGDLGWYIRIAAYNPAGALDTTVGESGIVAFYNSTTNPEPALVNGKRIQQIELKPFGVGAAKVLTKCVVEIDWEALTAGNTNYASGGYNGAGLSELAFSKRASETAPVLASRIPRNPRIWASGNTFSIARLDQFVLDAVIDGANPTKRYGIERISFANTDPGRRFISLNEYASDGTPGVRVALFDTLTNAARPPATAEGMIETVYLAPQSGSGVSATMRVNWSALKGTGGPNGSGSAWLYSPIPVTESELSIQATDGDIQPTGYNVITLSINGVAARLTTSDGYGNGEPDTLIILMHGNGGNETYAPSASFQAWARANKVSYACIKGQDFTTGPYGSAASGWGGDIHRKRNQWLYDYLMANFDLHPSVILAGASMGGLVMGQLAYYKPFPIRFCLGIGPVPSLAYIFANGGETRKDPIRNAFGMASGGGDDANLATFIKGYDWFDLGMSADASPRKYGFPRMYLYAGDGDTTYSVDFGGATNYNAIKDSIQRAGGFCTFSVVSGVTHADLTLWDRVLSDGVMAKEL